MSAYPRPTCDYIRKRLSEFGGVSQFFGADSTINLVVGQWPKNQVKDEILAKVLVIDSLYSTNIYYPDALAEHILSKNIDEALQAGSSAVVEEIATVEVLPSKLIRYYSFATKYCSFHKPDSYHIYDSYIEWLLWEYRKEHQFSHVKRGDIRASYEHFAGMISDFVQYFGLEALTKKQLDKFLWIEAQAEPMDIGSR